MLDEVVWCVSDPPQQARLDNLHAAAPFADVRSARCGACTPYPHLNSHVDCIPRTLIPMCNLAACTIHPHAHSFPYVTHPLYHPCPCSPHTQAHPIPVSCCLIQMLMPNLLRLQGIWCSQHWQASKILMWHWAVTSVRCLREGCAACRMQLGAQLRANDCQMACL